ncbi:MAG: PH domain-containing protein, partial [Mycobacterium sp.]
HEVLRQLPLLIGTLVLGSATGNPWWGVLVLVASVTFGILRWFLTTYRIAPEEIQLRSGVLRRTVLSLPRNRIRSVSTDARLLHRLLGLTVLRVSTSQEARGDGDFTLDGVAVEQVPRLRAVLLADSLAVTQQAGTPGRILARWHPRWLRYSPLSFTGLAMIAAAVGIAYQAGAPRALRDSTLTQSGLDVAQRVGAPAVAAAAIAVLAASVVLSVVRSLVTYGNLLLRRDGDLLHLEHGLLRVRENTFDMRRLRGGTLREALLVRAFGGARLDAVMTGVNGAGESSLLLPPCPAATAQAVLADLIANPDAVSGPLRGHGPAATRRRWIRALAIPAVLGIVAAVLGVPVWAWVAWAACAVCCGLWAADRARSLGHRVSRGWLVARSGSLERRRDCIAGAGIVGWTVRQSWSQRRAGVATLIAATAAGVKSYEVIDVPAELAWSIAAAASPWVAHNRWARH